MAERGQRIADVATRHIDCSSRQNVAVYQDVVRRPSDADPMFDQFYLHNKDMSSCGLFAVGALRLAGCTEPECVAPYFPKGGPERDAVADVQMLARRVGAWVTSSPPVPPFEAGDVWIVANDLGADAHVGVCVADEVAQPDGTRVVDTCEGGQFSGSDSSAIGAFVRTWRYVGNRWMLGNRYLVGFARASSLPIPDENA
jgi:hypothetical protein